MVHFAWPKRCKCGRSFDALAWAELPYIGEIPEERAPIEMRNCACGSTIAVELPPSPSPSRSAIRDRDALAERVKGLEAALREIARAGTEAAAGSASPAESIGRITRVATRALAEAAATEGRRRSKKRR